LPVFPLLCLSPMVGDIEQCIHLSICLSVWLSVYPIPRAKMVHFGLWLTLIGKPMLEVEPTDQCGHQKWSTRQRSHHWCRFKSMCYVVAPSISTVELPSPGGGGISFCHVIRSEKASCFADRVTQSQWLSLFLHSILFLGIAVFTVKPQFSLEDAYEGLIFSGLRWASLAFSCVW